MLNTCLLYLWFIVVSLILLFHGSGICADTNGKYFVSGRGVSSCGQFVTDRRNGNDIAYKEWLSGYITAVNEKTKDTYDILGRTSQNALSKINSAMLWIEN